LEARNLGIPTVAIVGRPNVGKSTLFNRILKKKLAVVEDVPGVTRDRNYAAAVYEGRSFTVIDTGGFEPVSEDNVLSQMREQTELAVQEADLIIFIADAREGLSISDLKVAEILRKSGKPVLYCVNKVDGPKLEEEVYDFYRLGAEELYPVSALHGPGFVELMDRMLELLPPETEVSEAEEIAANIAIIGRPNVGKSTLLNALTGSKRAVTDNVPGTTVDPVDIEVKYYGKTYNLVDTAGIRSRGKIATGIEKYSVIRALKAVERCDAAFLLIDASEGVTEQDKRIGGIAHEEGKGIIIVLNKWDLVGKEEKNFDDYVKKVREEMKYLDYAPVVAISALTKQRIGKLYELVDEVVAEGRRRVSTPELNNILDSAVKAHPPGIYKGRRVKFYFGTQVGVSPPTFIFFVNRPEGVHFSYLRYLENRLREKFAFKGNPVRIFLKKRKREEEERTPKG
jgi:GTP-binding protein